VTACVPGEHELLAPTLTSDRVCKKCTPHTFSDRNNAISCTDCAEGEYQPKEGQLRCLQSARDQFVVKYQRQGEAASRERLPCPKRVNPAVPEVSCGSGLFKFNEGFWHDGLVEVAEGVYHSTLLNGSADTVLSENFYVCPYRGATRLPSACAFADSRYGVLKCQNNTAGILCALCKAAHFHQGTGCTKCPTSDDLSNLPWLYIVLGFIAVMLLSWQLGKWYFRRRGTSTCDTVQDAAACTSLGASFMTRTRPLAKQLVSFYQVIVLIADVYQVQYPSLYLAWLDVFMFVNLDFTYVVRLECIPNYSWHTTMYTSLVMFALLTVTQVVLLWSIETGRTQRALARSAAKWGALVTYFLYPSFSNTLFQAFGCHEVKGVQYLRRDYSIKCSEHRHRTAQVFAGLGIVFCSIGFPVVYLIVLLRRRRRGRAEGKLGEPSNHREGQQQSRGGLSGLKLCADDEHLTFFVEDYKPKYWYWEAVELTRKLLLTGGCALFLPGTLMQIIMSMFITFSNVIYVAYARPYVGHAPTTVGGNLVQTSGQLWQLQKKNSKVANAFALWVIVSTFLSLMGALLVKFNSGFQSTGAIEEGYSYMTLQYFLVITLVSTGVVGAGLLMQEIDVKAGCLSVLKMIEHKFPEVLCCAAWCGLYIDAKDRRTTHNAQEPSLHDACMTSRGFPCLLVKDSSGSLPRTKNSLVLRTFDKKISMHDAMDDRQLVLHEWPASKIDRISHIVIVKFVSGEVVEFEVTPVAQCAGEPGTLGCVVVDDPTGSLPQDGRQLLLRMAHKGMSICDAMADGHPELQQWSAAEIDGTCHQISIKLLSGDTVVLQMGQDGANGVMRSWYSEARECKTSSFESTGAAGGRYRQGKSTKTNMNKAGCTTPIVSGKVPIARKPKLARHEVDKLVGVAAGRRRERQPTCTNPMAGVRWARPLETPNLGSFG
jgi:hypothetical protein